MDELSECPSVLQHRTWSAEQESCPTASLPTSEELSSGDLEEE